MRTNTRQAILEIQDLVKKEQNLGSNMHITLAERAPVWRKQVNGTVSDISNRAAPMFKAARETQAKQQEVCLLD
jgi:hypothetical protein